MLMHEWLTFETWRSEKELRIDQNSWKNKIYEISKKYEWIARPPQKKTTISLKNEHIRTNTKKKNHQRTPLEKYAVKEKKNLNSCTCEWIWKIL